MSCSRWTPSSPRRETRSSCTTGPIDDTCWILIDGGPPGVFKKFLRPRIAQLRELYGFEDDEGFPLRLVMVSHIDSDHIAGIQDILQENVEAKEEHRPQPYELDTLWHIQLRRPAGKSGRRNALTGRGGRGLDRSWRPAPAEHEPRVQSRRPRVRSRAATCATPRKKLGLNVNAPFDGLVMRPEPGSPVTEVVFEHDLALTVIGPSPARVAEYQERWDKDLKKILEAEEEAADAASLQRRLRPSIWRVSPCWRRRAGSRCC